MGGAWRSRLGANYRDRHSVSSSQRPFSVSIKEIMKDRHSASTSHRMRGTGKTIGTGTLPENEREHERDR